MKMIYTLLIIGIATLLLVSAATFTNEIRIQIHHHTFINGLAKYQIFTFVVGILVSVAILTLNPESKKFLRLGELGLAAGKEKWLGINGKTSWKINGIQLLFFISLATAIFMFLAVKYTNNLNNFQWAFIPFILVFSFTNSLTEELIFRFGIIGGLFNKYSKLTIMIISAISFGLPHFFGWPSGVIGVLMASVLGYVLCKACIETKGIFLAWTIHFIQDLIIFTALFMMNVK